jgi:hypothetical protein
VTGLQTSSATGGRIRFREACSRWSGPGKLARALASYGVVMHHLGETARMGPLLLAEVERQLLADLEHHDFSQLGLKIDWSDACGEGHCTRYLDGNLEALSGLAVVASTGEAVAEGWLDFVHGGDGYPLFVFWLFLSIRIGGEWKKVKSEPVIPEHVWDRLQIRARRLAAGKERMMQGGQEIPKSLRGDAG